MKDIIFPFLLCGQYLLDDPPCEMRDFTFGFFTYERPEGSVSPFQVRLTAAIGATAPGGCCCRCNGVRQIFPGAPLG